jgi:hypothetical protein
MASEDIQTKPIEAVPEPVGDDSLKKAKMLGSVKSKYSKSEWEATEKKLDDFSLKVLKTLFNYFGDSKETI